MNNFKLSRKEEEQKIIEEEKKQTVINAQKNINFTSKNPKTTGALVLGIIACVLMFLPNGGFFEIILVIFAARKLLRAKKIGEHKKYVNFCYVIVYLPVLIWILNSIAFAMQMINNAT